jgi:hypothetical protein
VVVEAFANGFAAYTRRASGWRAAAIVGIAVWAPRIASACPVCMAGRDEENRIAFIATTAFLTFFPLLMIGGVVWWLRKRVRQVERSAPVAPAVAPGREPAPSRAA